MHPVGVESGVADTFLVRTHFLAKGPPEAVAVVFLHDILSSSRFWDETLAELPEDLRGLAPDLRGFGESEAKPVDATLGLRDFAHDLHRFTRVEGLEPSFHLVGWGLGAGIAMQYASTHPERVRSLVLVAPISPYGFLGTRDVEGAACFPDAAGSGAGAFPRALVELLRAGNRGDGGILSPRGFLKGIHSCGAGMPHEREETLLEEMLKTAVGYEVFPGNVTISPNWPGIAPGNLGVLNAMSAKYCYLTLLLKTDPKPPVLWVRGADDRLISDESVLDPALRAQRGELPDWPGAQVFPPQPMIRQTRAFLRLYEEQGGSCSEEVIEDCGHAPHLDQAKTFQQLVFDFLERVEDAHR